ncbi:biotin carboxylase subunit of acetyl CoA carboxylase, putative [Plasmodium gallinaceum]|uniref:Biotin carboxylase subunit of acetyl CoA carboxylase, putative n=1 Tax=Plasmodium gallinaceum TaxID=5849 RepID=A0A1J1GQS9_PLAGA|nr:biotin carboxylase subunit of acetyl CoA carboxylase, putative [Plasmodium gallinaceum]CRG94893.1 biotin carboxylase subunit of acetyl CoA carboxylase, putative [Plasmodium gallinaceum]
MIKNFLSLFLFVLIFEKLVECIKNRNIHYLHMHNNVNKNNFNEKDTREICYSIKGNHNILHVNNRNRQIPLFVSKGTKIFHSFFKNNRSKYLDTPKNDSKNTSFSLNFHNFSENFDKTSNNKKGNTQNIFSEHYLSKSGNNTYTKKNELNKVFLNITSNDNEVQNSVNENYSVDANDYNYEYLSENNKSKYYLEHSSDNNLSYNNKEKNNVLQNLNKDNLMDSYFSKSKSDILFDNSDNILLNKGLINKMNLKKKKKNLNKLFYSFKISNNFLLLKKKNKINSDNIHYNNNSEYRTYSKGVNRDDLTNEYILEENICNKENKILDKSTNNNDNIGVLENNSDFLTYEEKNRIKKKAYEEYINYVNERRYPYFNFLKNKNDKIIKKLLIANNGMAALKCILSLKEWLFKNFYDENLIKIIVLATEDDIKSNTKYISLSDKVIKVPPGKNINNYANVPLIVDIAKKENVDAVWPGWGHCSENPLLSTLLEKENIIFIGPTGRVMEALGDKISANILAQSVNVPVVKWSGDDIKIKDFENNISEDIYNEATIHSLEECINECKRIGFPVMIKASQGGGGKGIRKVENENEVKKAYEQVQNELPNSPIFLMKVCNNVRHIEIQVVGDMYGNVCSLSGRDCTTQRRFQKIFEEGPPLIVPPDIFREMEKSSIRLTKMIKYRGAGTVEYLYDQIKQKYYFLELNPRLQVEHPVSEGITNSNLIAIQLQVAMGIPLQNIDDIKKLYRIEEITNKNLSHIKKEGKNGFKETHEKYMLNNNSNVSNISNFSNISNISTNMHTLKTKNLKDIEIFDFYNNRPYVNNYVISARITAENSNDSFKPTSGKVKRINFQNSNDVWGYFSINDGFVHEFSDSQIGHIFAKGETREIARRNLILSLRKLNIDGEIKTVTKYLAKILESKAFIDNNITTNWLDTIIKEKKNIYYNTYHIIILCATIFKLICYFMSEKEKVEDNLNRDDIGIKSENDNASDLKKKVKNAYIFDMVFENMKYCFKGFNIGENLYKLEINGQQIEVMAEYDKENNKIFASFHNQTYIYTCSEDSLGIHMNLEKDNIFIPKISNPFHLISNTNGKIVKYLINDGDEVKKNEDYIEVEAMKMIMTFKSTETGILKHKKSEGSIIKIGDLLGVIEKGENSKLEEENKIELFNGQLDLSNKYAYELKDPVFSSSIEFNDENNNENNNDNINRDTSFRQMETLKLNEEENNTSLNEERNIGGNISNNVGNLYKTLTKEDTIYVEGKKNSYDVIYEEEEMSPGENKKKRLFLKHKKKIFRLFSHKNHNEKKIMPINYLNNKLNCMKTYLTNFNAPNTNSLPNNNTLNDNSTISDLINISTNYNSINSDSLNNWVSNNSIESDLTNNLTNLNLTNDNLSNNNVTNDNLSFDNTTSNNITNNNTSYEIVSTRNTSNEKLSNNEISNNETSNNTTNNNSSNENITNNNTTNNETSNNTTNNNSSNNTTNNNSSNNTTNNNSSNDNSSNGCKMNNNETPDNIPKNNNFLLDIPNMKRIEYLLKGYEQNYEECFKKLLEEDGFFNNVNYILDKFIEYNNLFSKKESITEVEIYDILYNSISDKKKQYEIIHAYTYNYLSIQFVEKILSYLIKNRETVLPSYILDKIKVLETFKGKIFGNIVLLSRLIIYLYKHYELNEYFKSILNYNTIEENKKNELNIYMKNNNINYSKIEELINSNNYEKIIEIFLKDSSNIHMFVPSLFNSQNNYIFLEIYLKNLYKYFDIKTVWVSNNLLKFSINNSEFDNILILNEKDTIDINNILKEELKTDTHLNNIHIINKNDNFFSSIENNLDALLKECNNLYVYNYSMNNYGDIYEWKGKESENLTNTENEENLNLLPFEKYIFSFKEILKNYKIKNVGEKKFTKTKLFLGSYKNDNKNTSLFAHKLIDLNNLKELNKYKIQKLESNDIKETENSFIEEKKLIYNDFMQELKESLNDIEIGRMNPLVTYNKISSYVIYSVIIDNVEEINNIEEVYKNFLNSYNELLIQNYVNDVYINIYTKTNEDIKTGPKLKLEKLLKLHVLFDNEKNVIEEVDNYDFKIDSVYLKRKRARDTDTIYAYDFIKLINISLNRMNKTLNSNFNYINSIKEFKLDYISEKNPNEIFDEKKESTNDNSLFENYDNLSDYEIKIKKSLYLSNKLDLGQNKMSVIGLLMNIKTDEYSKGRDVVFIINDITTFGGSFSILEDELFYGISSYAREKKIPRIYISCNSGARIGLYNFLMDKIKISWKDEKKKELGYNYIYITEDVKNKIDKEDIVFLREVIENNEKRYIIDGIVGNLKNPVGVENLRGSGLIAGETSKAYEQIFTLSYVTGRSVGIGAYLVRLGKRTIQKKGSSLLLTGFNALNKLLGEKVYVSNEQLGGVNIMMRNGISQLEAQNDQDGVDKIIKWLSYVPKTSNDYYDIIEKEQEEHEKEKYENNPEFTKTCDSCVINENVERHIEKKDVNNLDNNLSNNVEENSEKNNKGNTEYLRRENKINNKYVETIDQEKNMKFFIKKINDIDADDIDNLNVIDLIKGTDTKQGFLDKNSYFEYMNEWGKGIITGRGKLGSIPVGFIAVNKNLVTKTIPCDPVLKTKSVKSPQAPCVFFPDNSYKTAQAIEDFNKENLPLFVFANWRGFSGGSMDMFNSILKFGSMIVNQLVNYKHPVFVYIPIFGELRGGSWVVVDETLNSQIIEMYADTTSKGGILEPPGIVEIKFRFPEIRKLMHNTDSSIIELNKKLSTAQDEEISKIKKEIEEKEKELLPFYLQVCHRYADLHDVSTCMKSKGVIKKIVPWKNARSFFYYRLLRRLLIKILNKKYSNSLIKSDEIKKIIDDISGSEEDDYEACKKILNEKTLKTIKELSNDILYKKTLNDFYNTFKILSEEQKIQLINQISSYK